MGYRTSRDWPLSNYGAFFEVNDSHVAFTIHNISHRDVQSFSRGLDSDARGITTGQLNAAHQFGGLRIYDVDRGVRSSMRAAAAKIFKDFDAGVKQMGRGIISRVIRSPIRIAKCG